MNTQDSSHVVHLNTRKHSCQIIAFFLLPTEELRATGGIKKCRHSRMLDAYANLFDLRLLFVIKLFGCLFLDTYRNLFFLSNSFIYLILLFI